MAPLPEGGAGWNHSQPTSHTGPKRRYHVSVILSRLYYPSAAGESKDHTDRDDDRQSAPDPLYGCLCLFVIEETHMLAVSC